MAIDFASLMPDVARELLGEPNARLSSAKKWRYGTHGSLSVDIENGTWCDHEQNDEGGGVLSLIARQAHTNANGGAVQWLKDHGFRIEDDEPHVAQRAERKIAAVYAYTDELGMNLSEVVRYDPKDFRQRRKALPTDNPVEVKGGWIWSVKGIRQVPYKLPELLETLSQDRPVFIVEGEKDVENLAAIGVSATTNAGGAGKWQPGFREYFVDADVIVIADNDPQAKNPDGTPKVHPDGRPVLPGQDHAHAIYNSLVGTAKRVRLLSIPGLPPKGDVSDWIAGGGTAKALFELAARHATAPANTKSNVTATEDPRPPDFTDEALALDFAARHADDLRFVAAWSHWMIWDGRHWKLDETLRAFDLARAICRQAAADCDNPRVSSTLASARTVANVERLAKADRRLAATADHWDADPWLLNTPSGVVDLRTGALRPQPDDYMTKITAIAPDPNCAIPLWTRVLHTAADGAPALVAFLKRMVGYALTGETREHALFFLYGTGANGKGTFLNTVAACAGDYATSAPIETFSASNIERHPTELADLRGARLVIVTETEEGRCWAESRLKMLTGGDKVKARRMRQDFFEYLPQFKLVISGNHKPGIRHVDEAMRRRINLVPFTVTIPAKDRDIQLSERLKGEWPGILSWMIEGTTEWLESGLAPPEAVTSATAAYLEAEDAFPTWIEEECEHSPDAWTPTSVLFESWSAWALKNGEYAGKRKQFPDRLELHGFKPERRRTARGFRGVDIRRREGDERIVPSQDWSP